MIGEKVLVRSNLAGVHFGTLKSRDGKDVVLENATRIWRWRGANTSLELSQKGAAEDFTRISEAVPEIALIEVFEIIPCSPGAAENLARSRWNG